MKKEKDSYVFSSRTFEGFCKDNNISREEGLKAIVDRLEMLLKEKTKRDLEKKQ